MIDNLMREAVKDLAQEELKRSSEIHPPFADMHHGYAVIKEEIEEVENELELLKKQLDYLWYGIKRDNVKDLSTPVKLKNIAIELALEAIQVAAVAQKIIDMPKL